MAKEQLEVSVPQEAVNAKPITEQEPIEKNKNELVWKRERLEGLVEPPFLKACEELYDKNIRTLSTSANKKDVAVGYAHMIIEVASMSSENVTIAEDVATEEGNEIVEYDRRQALVVHIPVDETTTTGEIEEQSMEIASKFKRQPLTWTPVLTLDVLKTRYGIEASSTEYDDSQAWVDEGYYYDAGSGRFYLSEEHFRKIKEFS